MKCYYCVISIPASATPVSVWSVAVTAWCSDDAVSVCVADVDSHSS